jgi:hypothetical protein
VLFPAVTPLINLPGFAGGAALYLLLLLRVTRHPVKLAAEAELRALHSSFQTDFHKRILFDYLWKLDF